MELKRVITTSFILFIIILNQLTCGCISKQHTEQTETPAYTGTEAVSEDIEELNEKTQENTVEEKETLKQHEYIASVNTKIFHKIDCIHAKKIKQENRIYFTDKTEALSRGYRPCKKCIKETD